MLSAVAELLVLTNYSKSEAFDNMVLVPVNHFAQVLSGVFILYVVYYQLAVSSLFVRSHSDTSELRIYLQAEVS